MNKNIVVDTNVVIEEPLFFKKFKQTNILIPIFVIEELDQLKNEYGRVGKNAREFSRILNRLFSFGDLTSGVEQDSQNIIKIIFEQKTHPALKGKEDVDSKILRSALKIQEESKNCTFITDDINLRLKAKALGLDSESFHRTRASREVYSGYDELYVEREEIDDLYEYGSLEFYEEDLFPNQFLILRNQENPSQTGLGIHKSNGKISKLNPFREEVFGIRPRNVEQRFALHAVLDDSIKLVILLGPAGGGKTLMATAGGLKKVIEEEKYGKLLIARPIIPMGKDLGYLPGDIQDKMDPWMKPIHDNIEFLLKQKGNKLSELSKDLMHFGYLQVEPLTYIRGRSISNQYMLLDEAQNLSKHEIKTILSRAGENTKIVLTGDPSQIDASHLSYEDNGLMYVLDKFKNQEISASVKMIKTERSELAELAAKLL